jgi:hypothetical protein
LIIHDPTLPFPGIELFYSQALNSSIPERWARLVGVYCAQGVSGAVATVSATAAMTVGVPRSGARHAAGLANTGRGTKAFCAPINTSAIYPAPPAFHAVRASSMRRN